MQRKKLAILLAGLLLIGLVVQGSIEANRESTTYDESTYVDAGYYLLKGHPINLEHPPLAKLLFGLATQVFASPRPSKEGPETQKWLLGEALSVARWVNIVLSVLLAILVVVWSREAGIAAAFGAIVVTVFDPTLIAHAHLATLDLPSALTVGLTCYCAERLDSRPSPLRFCALVLALTAAFLTKWSAFVLIAALPLAAAFGSFARGRNTRTMINRTALQVLGIVLALGVMVLAYGTFWRVGDLRTGLLFQLNHASNGHVEFLRGKVSGDPGWYYFLFALAVKSPLPFLPLVIMGGWSVRRRTFLWIPPIVVLVLASLSSVKLGIRYLLPGYVMLYVLAGIGFQYLWAKRHRWLRFASVGLLVGYCLSSLAAFPEHIAYFNEVALISSWKGQDWLNGSNADWGQGLKTLREDLQRLNIRDICLDYDWPPYAASNGTAFYLGPIHVVGPGLCRYVAVSSSYLFTHPEVAPLRHQRPLNGGPIYIFDQKSGSTRS